MKQRKLDLGPPYYLHGAHLSSYTAVDDHDADDMQADSPPQSASDGDPEALSSSATAPGPARTSSAKRKRGRVNPTQLAHLERAYAKDRSLDAARRKEISEALGMEERQTQIWFQNRRAKAKLLEQRARFNQLATSDASDAPQHPSAFSADLPSKDLKSVLQEEDRPCPLFPLSLSGVSLTLIPSSLLCSYSYLYHTMH